ncbi:hypothetical protein D3C81_612090 [compost metagenome]
MKYLHHFQVNGELSKPTKFHGYQLEHKYGMVRLIYFAHVGQQLVHKVAHPYHANIGTRTDQHNICLDQPNDRSLLTFEHYELQIADR